MYKLLSLSLISIPLFVHAEQASLASIEIVSSESSSLVIEEKNDAVYAGDKVFQKEGYMKAAPMQKQISAQRALEVAGSNGDPIKALKSFAGIVSTNNDEGASLYIHGSKPRETRFTINHLPVGYLFHMGGLHSVIAPEMTGQIDAYLGGFDVSYGAMGAVVDITPKYPTGSGKGRVHVGLYDADFAFDAKLTENTSLFVSARRSYFDLVADKLIDEINSDKDDARKKTTFTLFPQFYDAQLILSHQAGDELFSLEMLAAGDKLKIHDTFNIEKDPVAVGKINVDIRSNTMGARWIHMGDRITSNTLLYRLKTQANNTFYDANYYVKATLEEYGLYHETILSLDKHKVSLGAELKKIKAPNKVRSNRPFVDDNGAPVSTQEVIELDKTFHANEYTLFAQDIWELSPKDHFRYGLRVWKTDFQAFGSGIDPRFAYVHDIDNDFSLSASVGKYSQRPYTFMTIQDFGNPKIDTYEYSNHYTLSLQKKFADKSILLIEPYYKTFQNLAIADKDNRFEAVGEGTSYGVDITYNKKINGFDIMLAYTYVNARRELNTNSDTQYRFEGDIPHTLQLSTNYHFWDNWRVSAYAKISSGAPYTPIIGTTPYSYNGSVYLQPIYGNPYSARLDTNYDLDLQIGKTIKYANGSSLEFSLELMNINALFKENVSSIKYDDNYEEEGVYTQFGFLPAMHMTYRF